MVMVMAHATRVVRPQRRYLNLNLELLIVSIIDNPLRADCG
jgi:hypothetical protein